MGFGHLTLLWWLHRLILVVIEESILDELHQIWELTFILKVCFGINHFYEHDVTFRYTWCTSNACRLSLTIGSTLEGAWDYYCAQSVTGMPITEIKYIPYHGSILWTKYCLDRENLFLLCCIRAPSCIIHGMSWPKDGLRIASSKRDRSFSWSWNTTWL